MGPDCLPLVMLAKETQQMVRDLRDWLPVSVMAETLLGSVRGHDSISSFDIGQMRKWSRRWLSMPEQMRGFYAENAPAHQSASVALWHVLQGIPEQVSGPTCGSVYGLYRDWCGVEPPWTLLPKIK